MNDTAISGREIRLGAVGVRGAYVAEPAIGSGPGVVVLRGAAAGPTDVRSLCRRLAGEGYVALAPEPATECDLPAAAVTAAIATLWGLDRQVGGIGLIAIGVADLGAVLDAGSDDLACVVAFGGGAGAGVPCARARPGLPLAVHLGAEAAPDVEALRTAARSDPLLSVFFYPECGEGFAFEGGQTYDKPAADLAWSRTIAALKRVMGPHYDLEELWDHHLACEFVLQDADRTIETMVDAPYVNHIPTLTGGFGREALRHFYRHHFVGQVPRDRRTIPVSRTVGADRIVDEKIFCFTHDSPIDWMLPGVAPTGRYVEIPIVGIVAFRGTRLAHEHIYWDQASVLVQVGLLDPTGLPVSGVEQARKLVDPAVPSNAMLPSWRGPEDGI